ncbi:MAG: flagellar type III secretion system protein FliQ [Polyangiaceae bacterium]|nr:flagellar type III secretion system protein FliQ [Myxococcales bacterium]MCB9587308.1 flagellar type III secretion system protein FliQ [Polyangiaceae bacterium]MCB9605895.1 flagellar type III secretion system protein FliQ [Polyangiaceae bacterium]
MTTDSAIELIQNAMLMTAKAAGPLLLVALVVGLIVGVLQAATQVNEASISFVSKLVAVGVMLIVLGSWTMRSLVDYTQRSISSISNVVR